ncbi:cytochrome P450 [Cokeromyces recurvatus]|uniref:cytochrome P450 n=1 Tax=Cokeromyces recurvatus TaxID=90255 RepID=UPI00221EAE26|nr:cytochrome P450 [Cokeromyces recurvatus]KAI7902864.1 cytochrome P450 [Cokeromyces recurvatus]
MDTTTVINRTLGIAALTITALVIKYPDCAIFDENREGIAYNKGWPLLGGLPTILASSERIHEFFLSGFTNLNSLTTTTSALGMPRAIATIDPRNVEHILKHNFENYVKGPQFNTATGDLLGHGIFNANGEQWKYQRKTASHIFNVKNFRDRFTEVFVKELNVMSEYILDKAVNGHEIIDFHDVMFRFTLDSFILLGFGVELDALKSKDKVPFAASFDACQLDSFQRFVNPFWKLTAAFKNFINPGEKTTTQHLKTVDNFAHQVIEERRQNPEANNNNDLLSRFMNAHNEHGQPLNNKELRDIVLNFVIAGRDTTAQALSWAFYMLLLHPRVENHLLKEIHEYITDELTNDASQLYEVIKKMTYAHAVFYEVLRLYPSVPANQKFALNDDVWPDGTAIRKGDYVMWCPWAQGRSEAVWGPDAREFRPERWITPDGELKRESQGQWPAFHAGPRVCLGQNLATLEALVAMIFLVKQYKFKLVPNQNITYQVSLTLPMKEGMKVYVEKRDQ